jgi:hypothetical protein
VVTAVAWGVVSGGFWVSGVSCRCSWGSWAGGSVLVVVRLRLRSCKNLFLGAENILR